MADVLLPPKGMKVYTGSRMVAGPGGRLTFRPLTVMAGSQPEAAQMIRQTVAEAWAKYGKKERRD